MPRKPALPPLEVRWDHTTPLPIATVRPTETASRLPLGLQAPPWWESGPASQAFHFSQTMAQLGADIVTRSPDFSHIRIHQLLFTFTQARNNRRHGLQARVTPMRFRNGSLTQRYRGVRFQVQRFFVDQAEILYVMSFCLPRFLNQSFDEKLITIFHELYHISPFFNGDLRRHEGRYSLHTHSQKQYDQLMASLAREYIMQGGGSRAHAFLRLNFAQLQYRHHQITAHRVPRPKLIPLDSHPPLVISEAS